MKNFTVLATFKDGDGVHLAGEQVSLDDAAAAELLELGALAEIVVPAAEQTREAIIAAAVAQLDRANDDLWLKDGKPDAAAIADITGWPVTAAERDAAWTQVSGAGK